MNTCEYQCMECKMEFAINLMDKELDQKPKISCPHCGAKHVHNIAAACK